MNDFYGKNITVGDNVIFSMYDRFHRGKVIGFDDTWLCNTVIVEYESNGVNTTYSLLPDCVIVENLENMK